jgi:multidrug efflux pump subunit AcrA (membrane-fusion protein)
VAEPVLEQVEQEPPVAGKLAHAATGSAGPPVDRRDHEAELNRPTHPGLISPFRVIVLVVVLAAALVAWELTRPSTPTYRSAVVGIGTAVATLNSVGTVAPVNQASLVFNVSGTVDKVDVAVGQQVTAGEEVATLETTPLENSVVTAQASLASAQATLASDEASQTSSMAAASTSATSTTTSPMGSAPTGPGIQEIAKLQAALVADQTQLDEGAKVTTAALAEATTVCNAQLPATRAAAQPGFAPPPTSTTTATATTPSGSGTPPSCSQALSVASDAQAKVSADIATLNKDEAALTSALEVSGSGTGSTPRSSGSGAGSAVSGTGSAGGGSAAGSGSTSTAKVVTSQKLALDQASIDVAQAGLDNAQRALGDAILVSTISGTVGSVTFTPGESVTAGSTTSTPQVVVIGSGSTYQATTTVPVAKIGQVAVGQQVLVTPDSTGSQLNGTVTAIGVLATSGSTSTTYPVIVTLEASNLGLYSGAEAQLAIITGRAVGVTTVPSSAVRTVGSAHLVTVIDGATTKVVRVTLGTVGTLLTQVTSGVGRGQLVSLANINQPVPSSSITGTRTGFGGGGALLGRGGLRGGANGG